MNPYNFVPFDLDNPPQPRVPIWHHTLFSTSEQKVYSGELLLDIWTEKPLFIGTSPLPANYPDNPKEHIRNKAQQLIIPGTSLKGLLRTVVETLCRGCMTGYNDRHNKANWLPRNKNNKESPFLCCRNSEKLCISCRIFGMIGKSSPFLGKVSIEDAIVYPKTPEELKEKPDLATPLFLPLLDGPKPRHTAFYKNEDDDLVGRKFYYHRKDIVAPVALIKPDKDNPGQLHNQYVHPVAPGAWFSARLNFRNLTDEEFAALLFSITLEREGMRHQIGYAKPAGLGIIMIELNKMHLMHFDQRYRNMSKESSSGLATYTYDDLQDLVASRMAPLDRRIAQTWEDFRNLPALEALYEIWQWPAKDTDYFYPERDWFDKHPWAGIEETRKMSRADR